MLFRSSTSTRSLSTNVRLRDGQTLVLGGLIQTVDLVSDDGLPILSAIPLIGKLFSYRTRNKQTTELAIYITPHVMGDGDTGTDVRKAMEIMEKRIDGPTVDLPFHRDDPLAPVPEGVPHSDRSKDTVAPAAPVKSKLIQLPAETRPSQGVSADAAPVTGPDTAQAPPNQGPAASPPAAAVPPAPKTPTPVLSPDNASSGRPHL